MRSLKIVGFIIESKPKNLNFYLSVLLFSALRSKMDAAYPDNVFSYQDPKWEEREYFEKRLMFSKLVRTVSHGHS